MLDVYMIGVLLITFGIFFSFITWCDNIVGGGEDK